MDGRVTLEGERIIIDVPYSEINLNNARSLPDREFRKNPKPHWWVPATPWHAKCVMKLFPDAFVSDDVRRLRVLAKIELPEVDVPAGLYEFQKEAVAFIERAGGRAFVGDDPGTGKTIITLGWCNHRRQNLQNVLIVSPTVVTYKWKREVEKWLGAPASVIDSMKVPLPESGYVIMSYTMMRLREVELVIRQWDLIIFDEAHHLKNAKALQTKVGVRLGVLAPHRIMLSGKPFINQPSELFYPLHIMNPVAFPDWYRFVIRYTLGKDHRWTGLINGEELRERLESVLIRRTKKDVLTELPELQRVLLPFKLEPADEKKYRAVEAQALGEMPLKGSTMLWQAIGDAKRQVALDWTKNFMDENPNEKLVIYAHHMHSIIFLHDQLKDYGAVAIIGETPAPKREKLAQTFQESGRCRIMIIDTAANEGIDLYAASNILFAEREWVPNVEEQAESRLHRNGQKNAVTAWYLEAMDTFDEELAEVIEQKRRLFDAVLRSDEVLTNVWLDVVTRLKHRRQT